MQPFYTEQQELLRNTVAEFAANEVAPLAFEVDSEEKFLLENMEIAYLTNGRELIGVEGEVFKSQGELLLLANPAYDLKVASTSTTETSLRSLDFSGGFTQLPGTQKEADEIPALIMSEDKNITVLTGKEATEEEIKKSKSPRIMHLATHGFFYKDEEITPSDKI